eukprot:Rmarinus@m.30202
MLAHMRGSTTTIYVASVRRSFRLRPIVFRHLSGKPNVDKPRQDEKLRQECTPTPDRDPRPQPSAFATPATRPSPSPTSSSLPSRKMSDRLSGASLNFSRQLFPKDSNAGGPHRPTTPSEEKDLEGGPRSHRVMRFWRGMDAIGTLRKGAHMCGVDLSELWGDERNVVDAFCLAENYSLEFVYDYLKAHVVWDVVEMHEKEVVHIRRQRQRDRQDMHAFVFRNGTVVCWGMLATERKDLFKELRRYEIEPFPAVVGDHDYVFLQGPSTKRFSFKNDFIYLQDIDNVPDRISVSYALSQSVKLKGYENLIDDVLENVRSLPTQMWRHGKVDFNKKEITQKVGEMLYLRFRILGMSGIADEPDYFWEHPELQSIYDECCRGLGFTKRYDLVSQRLDLIKDIVETLNSEVNTKSMEGVERMILGLLAAEVALEGFPFIWNTALPALHVLSAKLVAALMGIS